MRDRCSGVVLVEVVVLLVVLVVVILKQVSFVRLVRCPLCFVFGGQCPVLMSVSRA